MIVCVPWPNISGISSYNAAAFRVRLNHSTMKQQSVHERSGPVGSCAGQEFLVIVMIKLRLKAEFMIHPVMINDS